MKRLILHVLASMVMLAGSFMSMAETVNITAAFSPSMDNPENNTFINTTPLSGYCATWPKYCAKGAFSIATGFNLTSNSATLLVSDSDPRDHVYFKLPPARVVTVEDEYGNKVDLSFSFTFLSAKMWHVPTPGTTAFNDLFFHLVAYLPAKELIILLWNTSNDIILLATIMLRNYFNGEYIFNEIIFTNKLIVNGANSL